MVYICFSVEYEWCHSIVRNVQGQNNPYFVESTSAFVKFSKETKFVS